MDRETKAGKVPHLYAAHSPVAKETASKHASGQAAQVRVVRSR